jgi:hypothetical protein
MKNRRVEEGKEPKRKFTKKRQYRNLLVIKEIEPIVVKGYYRRMVLVHCDSCGEHREIAMSGLGARYDCGCTRSYGIKHGQSQSPNGGKATYYFRLHNNLLTRCYNPNFKQAKDYSGKGVRMKKSWKNSFETFYNELIAAIGERPDESLTLDRINNNRGYYPDNVRWATRSEQCYNRNPYKSPNRWKHHNWLKGEKLRIDQDIAWIKANR